MSSKGKTTEPKEEATRALVPKLRFPEFRDSDAWRRNQLVGVCSRITQGGTPDTSNPAYWGGAINWMTPAEMGKTESPFMGATNRTITELGLSDCASDLLPINSVILSVRAPIGHLAINTAPTAINQGCKGLIAGKSLDNYFLYSSLLWAKSRLTDLGAGNTFKELSGSALKRFKIPVPSLAEQQQIAECLSSIDELIAAQARKVDALKTHKKGLMQQLFPREGETHPRLRFSNEGNWILMELPEVAFFQEGPGIMAVDFRGGGVPLVRLAGISGSVVTLNGCNYLDPAKVGQKWSHFRLELGDLLISTSATFGLSSIVTEAAAGAVFYTGLIRFRPSSDQLDRGFLKVYLASPHFERQAESAAVGGGIRHFGPTHLKQMNIPIPPLAEQQRTASCLSSLDGLITTEAQKLEALKTHKKGLMQQLFPSPEDADA